MKTAPSEAFQGAAEELVEVDIDEKELVGDLDAPNKDTNTPLHSLFPACIGPLPPGALYGVPLT